MISVVTPNYNGERWLDECLGSVAGQTISPDRMEMIVVDDGSTDSSREIVTRYSRQIPGMTAIWHEHVGNPGVLRNVGVQRAVGEYVLFLDSDDYLGTEALARLDDFVGTDTPDIVAFQLQGLNRRVPSSMLKQTIRNANVVSSGLFKTLGVWKLCRRQFLHEAGIRFSAEHPRGEDVLFFAEAMLRAKEVSVVSGYPFYTLRGREDGSSATQKEWDNTAHIDFALALARKVDRWAPSKEVADHFMIRVFNTDVVGMLSSPGISTAQLGRIRRELGPYWTPDVARLIYTEENRQCLSDFFEGSGQ